MYDFTDSWASSEQISADGCGLHASDIDVLIELDTALTLSLAANLSKWPLNLQLPCGPKSTFP